MFEKESEYYAREKYSSNTDPFIIAVADDAFKDGAEFGYNKAKEEIQAQDHSLGDFIVQYEDGKFKYKDKSGKVFESVDGKTWKEITLSNKPKGDWFVRDKEPL